MAQWKRFVMLTVGVGLLAVWPLRWAVDGVPDGLTAVEGGGAWPLHLLAEAIAALLCFWAAGSRRSRLVRPAALMAFGTLAYGAVNGLSYGVFGNPWHTGIAVAKLVTVLLLLEVLANDSRPQREYVPRWPGLLVGLIGLGMIGFWSMEVFAAGMLKDGLWTAEGDAYLIFHITAEYLAGLTALIGGFGVLRKRQPAVSTALAGGGGVLYAAVNSAGWAVLNDASLGVIFGVCSLLVMIAAAGLWRISTAGSVAARRRAA